MFFAAEEASSFAERFAARQVHTAVRTGNHRLSGGRGSGPLATFPGECGHGNIDDDDRDQEK